MAEALPGGGPADAPVFMIEKIYVKDLSLENPGAPESFRIQEPPQVDIGLRTRSDKIEGDVYLCTLTVTLTAKTGEKTLFLIEASQAGIFTIRNIPVESMQPVLAINCPNVLFPYIRETLADAVSRAGFPPIHLAPINFETVYQQQLAQAQAEAPAPAVVN